MPKKNAKGRIPLYKANRVVYVRPVDIKGWKEAGYSEDEAEGKKVKVSPLEDVSLVTEMRAVLLEKSGIDTVVKLSNETVFNIAKTLVTDEETASKIKEDAIALAGDK